MSQAELCAAQQAMAGGFNDPYRGPYLAAMAAGSDAALLANCTGLGSPPLVVLSPPGVLAPAAAQAACAASGVAMPRFPICAPRSIAPQHAAMACLAVPVCTPAAVAASFAHRYSSTLHLLTNPAAAAPAELPPVQVPTLPPALLPLDVPAPPPATPVDLNTVPVTVVEPSVGLAVSRIRCIALCIAAPEGPRNPPRACQACRGTPGWGILPTAARGTPPTLLLRRLLRRPPSGPACTPRKRRSLMTT